MFTPRSLLSKSNSESNCPISSISVLRSVNLLSQAKMVLRETFAAHTIKNLCFSHLVQITTQLPITHRKLRHVVSHLALLSLHSSWNITNQFRRPTCSRFRISAGLPVCKAASPFFGGNHFLVCLKSPAVNRLTFPCQKKDRDDTSD